LPERFYEILENEEYFESGGLKEEAEVDHDGTGVL